MKTKRLFVSLSVDPTVSNDIIKKFNTLNLPWEKIKKNSLEQIHLTLKFLGEISIEKIPELLDSLSKVDLNFENLNIEMDRTQIFNHRQPKVLAIAISNNSDLQKLYDQIEQVLFDDGLAHKEVRRFSPHLTLARVKQTANFEEFEEFNNWEINKSFFVSHFELKESTLSKTGPQHTTLQTFEL